MPSASGGLFFRIVLLAVLSGAVACATPRARTALPPPPMVVPAPPPRVLDPLPEPVVVEEPEPEPVPDPPRKPTRSTRPARPVEPQKPETGSTGQTGVLRTPGTADAAEAERRVADTLERTRRLLDRVRVAALDREGRLQLDNARRFVTQAEAAVQAKNYLFATYLADKAEALARDLAGR